MTAYFLLMPGIPMLFQGQEFAASSPFLYFADHEDELARAVANGRRTFLAQFPSLATARCRHELADPGDIETFRRSVLDNGERERQPEPMPSIAICWRCGATTRCSDGGRAGSRAR